MIPKRKTISVIFATYLLLVSQIFHNTNVTIYEWHKKRRARKNLVNVLIRSRLAIDAIRIKHVNRIRSKNKVRSVDFWERIVLQQFTDKDWQENFRVTKDTFDFIVEQLQNLLHPKENFLNIYRKIATVEKKVAVGLYYLGSCCEYRVVGNAFGIHKSTVHNIVHEFVLALNKILLPQLIRMPNDAEALENSSFFKQTSKLPNVIGSIDGTHIPILPPSQGYRDFINRKGWPSLVLQAVVDHKYRFIDICINSPGSMHDAAVLTGSKLYQNIQNIIPKSTTRLNEQDLPYIILGDSAYPLLPWLLKPYPTRGLTLEQDSFNAYMNSARVAVEIAFGRLKARWRTLLKRTDVDYNFVPDVVAACCTLHNVIENRKDYFPEHWMDEVKNAELIFPQPPMNHPRAVDDFGAHNLRDLLCNYLAANFPARQSKHI